MACCISRSATAGPVRRAVTRRTWPSLTARSCASIRSGTNGVNGQYGIPCTNPFVGRPGALGEIYAYGLRNPHRFSWDQGRRPRMFVGNIGEHNIESIYEVKAGDNFGWTEREGPFVVKDADPTCSVYPLPGNDHSFGYVYPVAAYDHDPPPGFPRCSDTGDAVIGGFVYRGRRLPDLKGKYVFGDDVNGRLFYTNASEMRRGKQLATIYEFSLFDVHGRRSPCRTWPATPGSTCASGATTTASCTCCPRPTARSGR